ncbi:MAG: MerR family transcriptional regulator [Gammaproteobacteria bacterium]
MNLPDKRYFTIGEVSTLCDLKPHVLRYWEQEFVELRPNKRRGNRRYYRREDVAMIQQIKHLLYEKGFTISGARAQLLAILPSQPEPTVSHGPAFSIEDRNAIRALLEEAKDILS